MELINIKLDAFEGPLDLLLHLIEKNELDIYDIPIVEITDQYMEYIKHFSQKDMEQLSEFLVMAATLLEIKSKMLLPSLPKVLEDEKDPREELVNRLIEYKRFKKIISIFQDKEIFAKKFVYKKPEKTVINLFKENSGYSFEDLLDGVTLQRLFTIFDETIRRRELKIDVIRSGFKSVSKDKFTVEEKIEYILDLLVLNKEISFTQIFSEFSLKMEKVITFLALLELVKVKKIKIKQHELFDDILIEKNEVEYGNATN